jgi:hypothetical protein
MKLRRLRVVDFAGIREAEIEFGPGLNVLYGPNDLGKSTLADAIRLALLLPHGSTHCEPYTPWAGGQDPIVELTFETEAQRIWRVRKKFGKGGSSFLEESKNGVDFDDVERGRKVDGKLREILRWGIPEPGGAGGGKGLPTSFLATVLISTQADVSDVLDSSLQGDPTATGKDRIAAALQAVAQDPLFVALLRDTQAKRDEAYTDKGAKKTAKGSLFKAAADRLNDARREKEQLQKIVEDSESVEAQLRELTARRAGHEETVAIARSRLDLLERLAVQAAALAAAAEQVRVAREGVARIHKIEVDVKTAEASVKDLARKEKDAQRALKDAQALRAEADAACGSAEKAARATRSDPAVTDTVARQSLELRKIAADQGAREAQQRLDSAGAAQRLVDAVRLAEREHRDQQAKADKARSDLADVEAKEEAAAQQIPRFDLLERALEARSADDRAAAARISLNKLTALRARLDAGVRERAGLAERRGALIVPSPAEIVSIRRLAADLAAARGALDVGLVVTVTPKRPLDLRVTRDGVTSDAPSTSVPLELEGNAEVDIEIGDVATVRVRGGRREAQAKVDTLERRWREQAQPLLKAARAADVEELDVKAAEARDLEVSLKAKDEALQSLESEVASLAGAQEELRDAASRAEACHAALGDVKLDTLASDIKSLGADPIGSLRKRRQQSAKDLDTARAAANVARTELTLEEERARASRSALDAAVVARDAALMAFPEGLASIRAGAQSALEAAAGEQRQVALELASLEATIAAEAARLEATLRSTRDAAEKARGRVEAAQAAVTKALTEHAAHTGRLDELRKLRAAEDLPAAENLLRLASERHAGMAVPDQIVTDAEVSAARLTLNQATRSFDGNEREIQRTHGALEQVGGAVARERLRDAIEAFESAERHEREIEADCEAWKLLLEQMKEADSAQASNLGQTLAPAIAGRFEALTERRYESVRLTAELGTEGVVVGGAVRSTERISVGTREQLSTLYRLSLAEYLQTTVVLDDQLVQSDDGRMGWFRKLLTEKARSYQIVVFTCRPGDYLPADVLPLPRDVVQTDSDAGFIRAVNLERAVQKR